MKIHRRLSLLAVSCIALPLCAQTSSIRPDLLRCEYRVNPLGIDSAQPRLSWVLAATSPNSRGLNQTAYRVFVASSSAKLRAGAGDLWDSGRMASDQSNQIVYAGRTLGSGSRAFWKVEVWDQAGKSSGWSAPAFWTMGLIAPDAWKAKWIGLDEDKPTDKDRVLPARFLRTEFDVKHKVKRATAYVSGLGLFELYLNGKKIGDQVLSPGLTDYDKRVLYVTFDLTPELSAGRNAAGLVLGNGRYFSPRIEKPISTRTFGYPKALLQVEIEYEDGTRSVVVSDERWKLSTAGPIRANNEYDGEEYDARMEMHGWSRAGFDDSKWEAARLVAAPAGKLVAQMAEPIRVMDTLHPIKITQPQPGVYVYDMGQNIVGWCRLKVSGPKGTQVTLRHAETLRSDGMLYTANLRSAKATDVYTLKGDGPEIWEPRFTYHGFRFVELRGFPGEPTLGTIEGRVVHDAMTQIADFSTSNPLLNQLHKNIFWGVRGNYRSIPTDCPQRDERQGWLGDRSQGCRSESYLFDIAAFYSKWMADLEDSQKDSGSVPDVAPSFWTIYSDNMTWPGTLVFVPQMLYEQYGDRRVLETSYPALKKWLTYMRRYVKDDLIDAGRIRRLVCAAGVARGHSLQGSRAPDRSRADREHLLLPSAPPAGSLCQDTGQAAGRR